MQIGPAGKSGYEVGKAAAVCFALFGNCEKFGEAGQYKTSQPALGSNRGTDADHQDAQPGMS